MPKYTVGIVRDTQVLPAVRAAVDLVGGMAKFVRPGERVFLKPNNIHPKYVPGTTTSREVVAAVAKLVLEAGGRPTIGEFGLTESHKSLAAGDTCAYHYRKALGALGVENDVALVDLAADEMVTVELPRAKILKQTQIAKTALQADKIIDLPVMKTHDQVWATLAIKNMKGLIPAPEKKQSHALGVEQAIVDLCAFIPPHLVVLDAMTAAEGMGPSGGTPIKMDVVLAGANALAVDLVGVTVMGFDYKRINYLQNAIADGLGPENLEDVDVLGLPIPAVKRKFLTAQEVIERQYAEMGINVLARNVCSGCWAEFRHVYYSLDHNERTKLNGITFVLGDVENPPENPKAIVVGKCAKKWAVCGQFVPGCPPDHQAIETATRRVAGLDEKTPE